MLEQRSWPYRHLELLTWSRNWTVALYQKLLTVRSKDFSLCDESTHDCSLHCQFFMDIYRGKWTSGFPSKEVEKRLETLTEDLSKIITVLDSLVGDLHKISRDANNASMECMWISDNLQLLYKGILQYWNMISDSFVLSEVINGGIYYGFFIQPKESRKKWCFKRVPYSSWS